MMASYPHLDEAINEESWIWLDDNAPLFATAVASEVKAGKTPKEIGRYIMKRTQRQSMALRCEQAAHYLKEKQTNG